MIHPDVPLLLAAGGASSRMGRPKHLLPFQRGNWIEWQLRRYRDAGGRRVILVLPEGAETGIQDPRLAKLQVEILRQAEPTLPMAASLILAAAAAMRVGAPAAWWLPVDAPAPGSEIWSGLEAALAMSPGSLAAVPTGGGHPVLLRRPLLAGLLDWDPGNPESRLDLLLRQVAAEGRLALGAATSPLCRLNLNTPGAWEGWLVDHRSLISGEEHGHA